MAENRELAICATCKSDLPLDSFHRGPKKNGRTSSCKSCMKAYAAKWSTESRERTLPRRREYMKMWRIKNAERLKDYTKQYIEKNSLERREQSRKSYAKHAPKRRAAALTRRNRNVELARAKCREWCEQNKDHRRTYKRDNNLLYRASWQRRRARERSAQGTWSPQDIESLFAQQSGRCAYCRRHLGEDFEVDHVIPLAKGGSNWPSNLALACPPCNRKKSARTDMKPFLQVSNG